MNKNSLSFFARLMLFFGKLFGRKKKDSGRPYPNYVKPQDRFTPKVRPEIGTQPGYHKGCFGSPKQTVFKQNTQRPIIAASLRKSRKNRSRNIRLKAMTGSSSRRRPFRIRKKSA